LVAAGRGAAVVPRLTLDGDPAVSVCPVPDLGGRHIVALHRAGRGHPTPTERTLLDALTTE
jgi:DNA-binding transcriptional LysR family regulator